MNTFTKPQLKTITDLAEAFFATHFPPREDNIYFTVSWERARKIYVDAIITGLTDPTHWGN